MYYYYHHCYHYHHYHHYYYFDYHYYYCHYYLNLYYYILLSMYHLLLIIIIYRSGVVGRGSLLDTEVLLFNGSYGLGFRFRVGVSVQCLGYGCRGWELRLRV